MELLYELYKVFSPSRKEKKMRKFIKDYIRRNIKDATYTVDKAGNLYVVKGDAQTYPCIVAHMDQVQDKHSKDFKVFGYKGKIFGFSGDNCRMEGPGCDDKNGIWVAMKCLQKYDVMKCAFFVGEEIGCVGSSEADMSFFKDCRWVIQCDRKNGGDLITNASGTELCSKEFVRAIHPDRFGYKETMGLMTDVMELKESGLNVSCVNMSCGYYRPHTDEEYTEQDELENCLAFVEWIVENVRDVYPHKYEGKWSSYYKGGKLGWYGWSDLEDMDSATGKDTGSSSYGYEWDEAYEYCMDMIQQYPMISDEELDEQLRYFYPSMPKHEREEVIYCASVDSVPEETNNLLDD